MTTELERLVRWPRRCWAKLTQPGTGGLIQPGDFRVCYHEDGKRSKWVSYGDAKNLADIFGGEIEWRGDT